jgi:hypothetical protein
MPRPATISLVNCPTYPAEEPDRLTRTLDRMSTYVANAAGLGADLVAFPEVCNWLGAPDWATKSEPLDGPSVTAMQEAARQAGVYVVCPLLTVTDGTLHNSSVLIGRSGEIAGVYHKNFLTHGELDAGIIPGTEAPVFETDFGRVGLCICFDLNYWEVGSALRDNRAELVIWSSMWDGARMLARWAIEFGFSMGAVYSNRSTVVDLVGRELVSLSRQVYDLTNGRAAPLVTTTIDMDRRALHHDYNLGRLEALYEKYGPTAAYAEWLPHECLLILGSQTPGKSTDDLIAEFGLEPMREYAARARRDRLRALEGTYLPGR